jgi:hypothetical protein
MSKPLATINLENKIDSILPKENHAYSHLKHMLLQDVAKENSNVLCNYIIAMRQESNISESTRRNLIAIIGRFIRHFNVIDKSKLFTDITHDDMVLYTQSLRKSEEEDPTQKWIGTFNLIISILQYSSLKCNNLFSLL